MALLCGWCRGVAGVAIEVSLSSIAVLVVVVVGGGWWCESTREMRRIRGPARKSEARCSSVCRDTPKHFPRTPCESMLPLNPRPDDASPHPGCACSGSRTSNIPPPFTRTLTFPSPPKNNTTYQHSSFREAYGPSFRKSHGTLFHGRMILRFTKPRIHRRTTPTNPTDPRPPYSPSSWTPGRPLR